ncbi:MAG: type II toxin-antitoxin system PemK/MazF family toxin [Acidobacteriota bacterium]|nr:type II toxin-antitoxin system PemK/MazF family toxin [Acidobacteriota bacterium]
MRQGDVFTYRFKEPNKSRPVLILTRTDLISQLNVVAIAEITTTLRDNDSEVWLNESDGMREDCAVNLTNLQTVAKNKIGLYITHLSAERMREVREAIEFAFNFKNL